MPCRTPYTKCHVCGYRKSYSYNGTTLLQIIWVTTHKGRVSFESLLMSNLIPGLACLPMVVCLGANLPAHVLMRDSTTQQTPQKTLGNHTSDTTNTMDKSQF